MKHRCPICLKYYSTKGNLKMHETVVCKKKFECIECMKLYSSKQRLTTHKCKPPPSDISNISENDNIINGNTDIANILKNILNDRPVNIIVNNNNHISNSNSNNDNSKTETNNIENNTNNTMNFLDTKPKSFQCYVDTGGYEELANLHDYEEKLADMYVYEEANFRKLHKDIVHKYDKEALQVEGMKLLFTKLQQDPNNRNAMIRKTKSGNCYIYEKDWVEKKLKKIITRICNNLCDKLYDKEKSMNHFMRLVLGSQPKRVMELRKHIETEILNNKKRLVENVIN